MTGFSHVLLVGNLTRDPQVRQTPSGAAVAELGVAANETVRNKEGESVEKTCFVDIVAWGRQAEACGEYLRKGAPVLVEGSLQFDQWETKEGDKRNRLRVRADRVQFLGAPRNGKNGGTEQDNAAAPAAAQQSRPPSRQGNAGKSRGF